jgi:heptose-I-phosphate ethanolaminephosphotransferase
LSIKVKVREWGNAKTDLRIPLIFFSLLITASIPDFLFYYEYPVFEFLKFIVSLLTISFLPACLALSDRKIFKILGWILFILIFSLSLFYSIHHILYSAPPTANVYVSLFETDRKEMLEYYETYLSTDLFLKIGGLLLSGIFLSSLLIKFKSKLSYRFRISALLFALLAPVTFVNLINKSPLRLINQFVIFQKEKARFLQIFNTKIPDDLKVTSPAGNEDSIVVLVLGESTSRRKLSLYGYPRKTTPQLDSIKNELIVFNNVISPHSHTVPSLQKVLSFLNFENETTLKSNPNVIQIAKLANYKTYWLSNQIPLGSQETPLAAIANNADHSAFIADQKSYRDQKSFDEGLQPVLEKVLKLPGNRKFIVLHLMGTHSSYRRRYPKKFSEFKGKMPHSLSLTEDQWQSYNEYDNAVLYNDFVLKQFIETIRPFKNSKLVYLSDHGEEVYDTSLISGHTEAIGTNPMFEIPFIIWQNKKIKTHYPLNSLWSSEDFIHSLHDILNFKTTYYEPSRSLLSKDFKEIPRMTGYKIYDPSEENLDCTAKSDFNPKSKIWLHRVNSIERFKLTKDDYEGFEIDLVWNGKILDVGHPPEPSINLNLESILSEDKKHDKYFWFDLKNLSPENVDAVANELVRLDKLFNLKKRVLVESENPSPLQKIRESGFYTSFYLPALDEKNPLDFFVKVMIGMKPYLSGISQTGSMMEVMEAKLKSCDKFIWLLGSDRETKKQIDEYKERKDVKVILVRERTDHYR